MMVSARCPLFPSKIGRTERKRLKFPNLGSERWKTLIPGIIIGICTFFYPALSGTIETRIYDYKSREEAVIQFVKSVTYSITYFNEMTLNYYKFKYDSNEDKELKEYYKNKVDVYFEKYTNIEIPYEMSCALLKIHFDESMYGAIDGFMDQMDKFMSTNIQNVTAATFEDYKKQRAFLWKKYDNILRLLIEDMKKARNKHVFYI